MPLIQHPERVCTGCMVGQGRHCHCRAQAVDGTGSQLPRNEAPASPVGRLMRVLLPMNPGLMAVARKPADLAAPRR